MPSITPVHQVATQAPHVAQGVQKKYCCLQFQIAVSAAVTGAALVCLVEVISDPQVCTDKDVSDFVNDNKYTVNCITTTACAVLSAVSISLVRMATPLKVRVAEAIYHYKRTKAAHAEESQNLVDLNRRIALLEKKLNNHNIYKAVHLPSS
jgi:hypothetical protein